ncbi:hypothetical protein O3M35_003928 [Rhynocoris fuscipes]|uniref:Uncharacterized protein n=1 Tax=Rhynocoris fuscipes TaxID=488301 RepID=A0AAW1CGV9_9HEMI
MVKSHQKKSLPSMNIEPQTCYHLVQIDKFCKTIPKKMNAKKSFQKYNLAVFKDTLKVLRYSEGTKIL